MPYGLPSTDTVWGLSSSSETRYVPNGCPELEVSVTYADGVSTSDPCTPPNFARGDSASPTPSPAVAFDFAVPGPTCIGPSKRELAWYSSTLTSNGSFASRTVAPV